MCRFLLALLVVAVVVEQGQCQLRFHDENIPEFPQGGLVIYAPGTGCQLGKYGDGMQFLVLWVTKGSFSNIVSRQVTGGTSLHFHYYDSDGNIYRKAKMNNKNPIWKPEEALEFIATRPHDDKRFVPLIRTFRQPGVGTWGGHTYEHHIGNFPYFIAKYLADQSKNEKGEQGYLLTVTSPEEQKFVTSFLEEQHKVFLEEERVRLRFNNEKILKEREAKLEDEKTAKDEEELIDPEKIVLRKSQVWLGARDERFEGFWEWEGGEYEGEVFYAIEGLDEDDEDEDEDEEFAVPTFVNWERKPKVQKYRNCVGLWDTWKVRGCDTNHAVIIEYGDNAPVIPKEEL